MFIKFCFWSITSYGSFLNGLLLQDKIQTRSLKHSTLPTHSATDCLHKHLSSYFISSNRNSRSPISHICLLSHTNHFHTWVFAYSLPPTWAPLFPFCIHIPTTLLDTICVPFSLRCYLQATLSRNYFLSSHCTSLMTIYVALVYWERTCRCRLFPLKI